MKKELKLTVDLLICCLGYITFYLLYKPNTIVSVLILCAMFRIVSMKKEIDMNKRKIYFSFFMAFLFSFVLVVGHNLVDCGKSKLYDIATTMEIILVIPFFLKTFSIFLSQQFNGICEKSSDSYKRRFFIYWICIFAAWIPMLLAFFPGNFTYDSTVQLGQVLDGAYTSHHPLVSTLFIGGLVKLGYKITKNWNMGVLLHSLVQMLIMSGVFSYVVCFISRRVTKKWIKYGSLAYFMFFPVHAVFAITTTKDVIFSAIVVLCVVELIKSFENEWNLRIGCVLIFLLFLFCIFRNNGKYALIFSIPFIFFCCRQRRKQILVVVITTLLLCSFHNVILEKVGVEKGNIREAYSIPIQQIGRTYNYKFDTLDPEEKQEIELLFLEEGRLKKYEARKADSLKDYFATDRLSKRDLKIYLKWGIQNPVEYIDAFLAMINGYFSFEDVLPDTETYRTYVEIRCAEYQDRTDIHLDSKCQFLYDFWYDYFQNAGWENIPFVSLFSSLAFFVWMFIFTFCYIWYRKKYNYLWIYSIVLGILLTNLLGPVALLRYTYPLIVCVPVNIYFIIKSGEEDKIEAKNPLEKDAFDLSEK